jgi:hypothetical protein
MNHSHLFKPPFKPASPDISNRRDERAGKLRARRGVSEATGNGGSGTHGGTSGLASFDNFMLPSRQQTSGSASRGKDAAAAADRSGQPSSSPPAGDAGSDGSQDSLLVKNGFGDGDSDNAEGYGSNPTGALMAALCKFPLHALRHVQQFCMLTTAGCPSLSGS